MRLHTWVYPWDVASIGADRFVGELIDLGLDGIDLNSNYHPIATLSPRSSRRVLYSELGAVFFPARPERYGRIAPLLWPEGDVLEVWPAVAERATRHGLQLNAWTIALFQPWIARHYPGTARVLPTGEENPATVCPANAHVREFFAAMGADLADQFPVRTIQLEGAAFHKFDYGWVRPRILTHVPPVAEWLLGLCFCDTCCGRGREHGLDVAGLRERLCAEIDSSLARERPEDATDSADTRRREMCAEVDDLNAYEALQADAVAGFLSEMARAVAAASPAARIGAWSPIQVDGSAGIDLDRSLDDLGSVLVWKPHLRMEQAQQIRRRTRSHPNKVDVVHFQACGWPHGVETPEFREEIEAGCRIDPDQVSFYNYGLVRRQDLARMVEITRSVAAGTAVGRGRG